MHQYQWMAEVGARYRQKYETSSFRQSFRACRLYLPALTSFRRSCCIASGCENNGKRNQKRCDRFKVPHLLRVCLR